MSTLTAKPTGRNITGLYMGTATHYRTPEGYFTVDHVEDGDNRHVTFVWPATSDGWVESYEPLLQRVTDSGMTDGDALAALGFEVKS